MRNFTKSPGIEEADSCPLASEAQKDAARFDAPETIFLILL